jgi:hypothetical protein
VFHTLRMCGALPPLPPYVFMAWSTVKHRDNFTFTCVFKVYNLKAILKSQDFQFSINFSLVSYGISQGKGPPIPVL